MKHTFRTIVVAAMAFATVAFIGCSKEESNNDNSSADGGGNNTDEWVDLGLPSGLLWASCNMGATSPEGYGEYFAWGEISTKNDYSWSTYAYGNTDTQLTKYCNKPYYGLNGFTDTLTILQLSDDAVNVCLGGGARIPTQEEWRELINNTTAEWTTQNGVNGRRYTAPNGKSIFLPAAGDCDGSVFNFVGSYGFYWSSSLETYQPNRAWLLCFALDYQNVGYAGRYEGRSVRAVRAR